MVYVYNFDNMAPITLPLPKPIWNYMLERADGFIKSKLFRLSKYFYQVYNCKPFVHNLVINSINSEIKKDEITLHSAIIGHNSNALSIITDVEITNSLVCLAPLHYKFTACLVKQLTLAEPIHLAEFRPLIQHGTIKQIQLHGVFQYDPFGFRSYLFIDDIFVMLPQTVRFSFELTPIQPTTLSRLTNFSRPQKIIEFNMKNIDGYALQSLEFYALKNFIRNQCDVNGKIEISFSGIAAVSRANFDPILAVRILMNQLEIEKEMNMYIKNLFKQFRAETRQQNT